MTEAIAVKFVDPTGPTQAQLRLHQMKEAFAALPKDEQEEVAHVQERLKFLRAKYGSSADLAIVYASIEISAERGQ